MSISEELTIKEQDSDAYLYFGYNQWTEEGRVDSEEEMSGQICFLKKENGRK